MGYTHYVTRDKRNVGSAWMFGKLALDAKKIIEQAKLEGIVIAGWDGKGEPEFTEGYFRFNGQELNDQDHETFSWEALPEQPEWWVKAYAGDREKKHQIFDFCKTNQKPYDTVVTAVLIRAKVIYGSCVDIGSDGGWETDWQNGRWLYEKVFGEQAVCPFTQVAV
jgi:hypothetical protein